MAQTGLPVSQKLLRPSTRRVSLMVPLWCFVSRLQEGLMLVFWDEVQTSLSSRYLLEGVSVQLYVRGYWKSRC